jgi:hypothetical protein
MGFPPRSKGEVGDGVEELEVKEAVVKAAVAAVEGVVKPTLPPPRLLLCSVRGAELSPDATKVAAARPQLLS